MKLRYGVDFSIGCWYVYDKKTDLSFKYFKTRQEARNYAKKLNKRSK